MLLYREKPGHLKGTSKPRMITITITINEMITVPQVVLTITITPATTSTVVKISWGSLSVKFWQPIKTKIIQYFMLTT